MRRNKELPNIERLREMYAYNPETGAVVRRLQRAEFARLA